MLLFTVVVVFIGCNMIRVCINTYEATPNMLDVRTFFEYFV